LLEATNLVKKAEIFADVDAAVKPFALSKK
jgi:hypothetical protein